MNLAFCRQRTRGLFGGFKQNFVFRKNMFANFSKIVIAFPGSVENNVSRLGCCKLSVVWLQCLPTSHVHGYASSSPRPAHRAIVSSHATRHWKEELLWSHAHWSDGDMLTVDPAELNLLGSHGKSTGCPKTHAARYFNLIFLILVVPPAQTDYRIR